jgi:hypothetical protein
MREVRLGDGRRGMGDNGHDVAPIRVLVEGRQERGRSDVAGEPKTAVSECSATAAYSRLQPEFLFA